jgi:exopolysaccharide production protein ExoQ
MPKVALIGSLLFSTLLILRDCRMRRKVSNAVWISTFLLLIAASRPLSEWVSGNSHFSGSAGAGGLGNDSSASPLDTGFFVAVLLGSLALTAMRGVRWKLFLRANQPIVVFYLFFYLSVFWSGDPTGSLKRIIKDSGLLLVTAVLYTETNPSEAMRAVYFRSASVLLPLSVVFIKYFPAYGRSYMIDGTMMFTGVTTQKNTLGEMCLVFGLFLGWDCMERIRTARGPIWKRAWAQFALLLMDAWLLRTSESKTALMCGLIGIFLTIRSMKFASPKVNRLVLGGGLALPFLIFFSQVFSSFIAPIVEALGRNMTFTGRTDIWNHISLHTVNPLVGAGYWNFWGGPGGYEIAEAMSTSIPNAHCGYIDIYLDGGLVGLALLFIVLISYGNRIIRQLWMRIDIDHFLRLRFAVLIAMLIYNNAESQFAGISPLWFTALLVMLSYPANAFARKARSVVSGVPVTGRYPEATAAAAR